MLLIILINKISSKMYLTNETFLDSIEKYIKIMWKKKSNM